MAKTRRKHRSQPQPAFYETLSSAAPAPVSLSQLAGEMPLVRQIFTEIGQFLWQTARPKATQLRAYAFEAGLATSDTILRGIQNVRFASHYSLEAAITYTPSITKDFAATLARIAHILSSKKAKISYALIAALAVVSFAATCINTATTTLKTYASDISSPAALLAKKKTGTIITDRNGQILFEGYGASSSGQVKLAEVPKTLQDATLAAEDPAFYDHPGFSLRGTMRAAVTDITHQNTQEGGSTLTQQLVKNALLTSQKNLERKYQELLLSIALEQRYSKDQILEMYLNETYYGEGSSGVEAASLTYFHKAPKDLTLGESALLAGLPLGPSRLDPNVNLAAATGRRNYVLDRMATLGKITSAAAKLAKAEPIQVYAKTITIRAPHFVFYVLDQLRTKYGEDMVENGNIKVQTTLDLSKQELAEQTVSARVSALASHHVTNGALISLEPKTGDIVAMVGSVDYNAPGFGNVNVTLSQLQPGSSFKPFAYATAFKKGWTGATTIDDVPLSVPNGDGTMYTPQNYDLRFHGVVTVRHALDNSLNIPAVKTLQFAGIHDTIQTAHDLGITTLQDESRYGLALVLGGGEVRPIDMATAYATFDNNGQRVEPRAILKVTDRYGKDITKPENTKPTTALDPRIAFMITSILTDDSSRQPEFPAGGPLTLTGRPAAAKTGTTNDFRDNWTVGYTPQLVTAVWVGNNDHTAMENVDGITGAAPIWHDYMQGALAADPVVNFTAPAGITTAKVCFSDGGIANPWDLGYSEVFMTTAVPTKPCATFVPQASKPTTPTDPGLPTFPVPPSITFPPFKFPPMPNTNPSN